MSGTRAEHGVLGLVKTLSLEGADDGIAAVAVRPGYVYTPLVERQTWLDRKLTLT